MPETTLQLYNNNPVYPAILAFDFAANSQVTLEEATVVVSAYVLSLLTLFVSPFFSVLAALLWILRAVVVSASVNRSVLLRLALCTRQ